MESNGNMRNKGMSNTIEEMAQLNIPTGDDFFDFKQTTNLNEGSERPFGKQQFYIQRKGKAGAQKFDPKSFDTKLVERSLELINEYQKMYQFSIVKC